jgi:hypothetical protein
MLRVQVSLAVPAQVDSGVSLGSDASAAHPA